MTKHKLSQSVDWETCALSLPALQHGNSLWQDQAPASTGRQSTDAKADAQVGFHGKVACRWDRRPESFLLQGI